MLFYNLLVLILCHIIISNLFNFLIKKYLIIYLPVFYIYLFNVFIEVDFKLFFDRINGIFSNFVFITLFHICK